jgi:hypothetical protein
MKCPQRSPLTPHIIYVDRFIEIERVVEREVERIVYVGRVVEVLAERIPRS